MKHLTMRRRLQILSAVAALMTGLAGTGSAQASPSAADCPNAEIFATNNTDIITDQSDPRLRTRLERFGRDVRAIIRAHGARPEASTLLDGVFWSAELKQATYERSREFDVERIGPDGLRHIAGVIAKTYHQESVLTFRCLTRTSPDTDAVQIQASGVTPTRLRDALLADPEAREELVGGSVTLDGKLILIAPLAELPVARRLTAALGVDWNEARVDYGDREFVS
ncbi:hypothetical protein [Streptomyces sp. NPDC127114]|uniref:hypothetical protein n=1 Tax=Streptomyces sp. NPDC127114 TaxID=3345366 RepID=UPI00362D1C08